jgi:hypothetical protein
MGVDLVNCSKCGHSTSSAAKVCAYCGAAISEGAPQRQAGDSMPGEQKFSNDAPSSRQRETPPPAIEIPESSKEIPQLDAMRAEPDTPDSSRAIHSAVETSSPVLQVAEEKIKEESVIELSEHGHLLESELEASRAPSEIPTDDQSITAESFKAPLPTSDPVPDGELMRKLTGQAAVAATPAGADLQDIDDQTKTDHAADKAAESPEPDMVKLTVNHRASSETTEAKIIEMMEGGAPLAIDESMPPKKSDIKVQTYIIKDDSPVDRVDKAAKNELEISPEASEDEILLTLDAEVQPVLDDTSNDLGLTEQPSTSGDIDHAEADPNEKIEKSEISPTVDKAHTDAEALPKPTEFQSPAKVLKIEKAAQEMEAALNKQKKAMAEANLAKKEKLNPAKEKAVQHKKAAVAKARAKEKEGKVGAEVNVLEKEALSADIPDAHSNMRDLLNKYLGHTIGINYDNSAEIKKAELLAANDEFFKVFVVEKNLYYSYPLKTILSVMEHSGGDGAAADVQEDEFSVVIKIYPLMP